MSQEYSDPKRAADPHALPDVEVWYRDQATCDKAIEMSCGEGSWMPEPGWYWWTCSPGCLPDSEPNGPFATYALALADAQLDSDG